MVIVVNPLNARIENATEANRASPLDVVAGSLNAPEAKPLTQIAAIANTAIPPILIADMTKENPLTDRFPAAFTR